MVNVVILFKLLALLDEAANVNRVKPIIRDFAPNELPEHRSKREDIHTLIVLSLLEEFRSHVNRRARILHRALSDVSLKKRIFIERYQHLL